MFINFGTKDKKKNKCTLISLNFALISTLLLLNNASINYCFAREYNQKEEQEEGQQQQNLIDSINQESDLFIKEIMDKKSVMLAKIKEKKARRAKNKEMTEKINEMESNISFIKSQINRNDQTQSLRQQRQQ